MLKVTSTIHLELTDTNKNHHVPKICPCPTAHMMLRHIRK